MGEKGSKTMWLKFFRDAGIASGFDTRYAVLFDENRMKPDMLVDINKECLKDMGITAMGDILAILKHGRKVVEETKTQAYDVPQPSSTSPGLNKATSNPTSSSSVASISHSTLSPRIVKASPIKSSVMMTASRAATVSVVPKTVISSVPMTRPKAVPVSTSVIRSTSQPKVTGVKHHQVQDNTSGKGRIVKLKREITPPQKEEVPLQKKIRVLPEHEGSYIVKMPSGNTPKTQKMLQDRLGPVSLSQPPKKGNVFARLGTVGESKVSSSTDVLLKTNSVSPHARKVSAFARLGTKTIAAGDRLDLMSKKVESSPTTQSIKMKPLMSSHFSKDPLLERRVIRQGRDASTSSNSSKVVSDASRMRSLQGDAANVSVKARLGKRGMPSSRSPSSSPPPPPAMMSSQAARPPRLVSRLSAQLAETAARKARLALVSSPQSFKAKSSLTYRRSELDPESSLSISRKMNRQERFK